MRPGYVSSREKGGATGTRGDTSTTSSVGGSRLREDREHPGKGAGLWSDSKARVHVLTLVTRNVKDVARTGVSIVNPFEHLPSG